MLLVPQTAAAAWTGVFCVSLLLGFGSRVIPLAWFLALLCSYEVCTVVVLLV